MSPGFDPVALAERIVAGEPLALARSISHVENETDGFETLLDRLDERVGRARRIGITMLLKFDSVPTLRSSKGFIHSAKIGATNGLPC